MKKIIAIFIITIFSFYGCATTYKENNLPVQEDTSVQENASLFPLSEYEKNFDFPPVIGPLTLAGETNFEKTDPGLGYSIKYRDNITVLDIYVYDLLVEHIPNDVVSEIVVSAFQQAANDIIEFGRRGDYSGLKYSQVRKVNLLGKDMLLGTFEFTYEGDKKEKYSILMLTVHKGKFFKVRLSINKQNDGSHERDLFEILKEITEKMLIRDIIKESI